MGGNIKLPSELAEVLTLEEIGTIFILYSMFSIDKDCINKWSNDPKLQDTLRNLINKEILTIDKSSGEFIIDVTKPRPTLPIMDWSI